MVVARESGNQAAGLAGEGFWPKCSLRCGHHCSNTAHRQHPSRGGLRGSTKEVVAKRVVNKECSPRRRGWSLMGGGHQEMATPCNCTFSALVEAVWRGSADGAVAEAGGHQGWVGEEEDQLPWGHFG